MAPYVFAIPLTALERRRLGQLILTQMLEKHFIALMPMSVHLLPATD